MKFIKGILVHNAQGLITVSAVTPVNEDEYIVFVFMETVAGLATIEKLKGAVDDVDVFFHSDE